MLALTFKQEFKVNAVIKDALINILSRQIYNRNIEMRVQLKHNCTNQRAVSHKFSHNAKH